MNLPPINQKKTPDLYVCEVCGKLGLFGYGASIKTGLTWRCAEHAKKKGED